MKKKKNIAVVLMGILAILALLVTAMAPIVYLISSQISPPAVEEVNEGEVITDVVDEDITEIITEGEIVE